MRFARDRRTPAWTYSTRGVLWRLQTESPDFLVGEERDLDAKKVSFFCLDRASGVPRWEGFVPEKGWWSGIEAVAGGLVLLHGFASPDMPLHGGLTAVDLASGSIVWDRPDVRFLRVEPGAVIVAKQGCVEGAVERLALEGGRGEGLAVELPRPFAESEIAHPRLLAAVRKALPGGAGSVVLMQDDDACVLSFFEARAGEGTGEERYRSSLVVLSGPEWKEIYSAVIQKSAATAGGEPFFCQKGVLYFVQERSTLVAVPLRIA